MKRYELIKDLPWEDADAVYVQAVEGSTVYISKNDPDSYFHNPEKYPKFFKLIG